MSAYKMPGCQAISPYLDREDMNRKPPTPMDTLPVDHLLATLGPAVLKSIRDPFGIFSPDFRIIWANKAMAKIHGTRIKTKREEAKKEMEDLGPILRA